MSATLKALIDLISPTLTADTTLESGRAISVLYGAENKDRKGVWPRVVFVPTGASFEAMDPHTALGTAPVPRPFKTRVVQFDARCWGGSVEDTERLINKVLSAFQTTTYGSWDVLSERWIAGDGAEVMQDGRLAVLSMSARLPVTFDDGSAQQLETYLSFSMAPHVTFPTSTVDLPTITVSE